MIRKSRLHQREDHFTRLSPWYCNAVEAACGLLTARQRLITMLQWRWDSMHRLEHQAQWRAAQSVVGKQKLVALRSALNKTLSCRSSRLCVHWPTLDQFPEPSLIVWRLTPPDGARRRSLTIESFLSFIRRKVRQCGIMSVAVDCRARGWYVTLHLPCVGRCGIGWSRRSIRVICALRILR